MDDAAKHVLQETLAHLQIAQAEIHEAFRTMAVQPIHGDDAVSGLFMRTQKLEGQTSDLIRAITATLKKD